MLSFLDVDAITLRAEGSDLESLVRELVPLALRGLDRAPDAGEIVAAVMEREADTSTCLGEGLAIPHARVRGLEDVAGALAISREGWDLPSLDGMPTHLVALILTPPELAHRHLEILAALARLVGGHPEIKNRLYRVDSAAEALELLRLAGNEEIP